MKRTKYLVVLSPLLLAGQALEETGRRLVSTTCLNLPVLTLPKLVAPGADELIDGTTNCPVVTLL